MVCWLIENLLSYYIIIQVEHTCPLLVKTSLFASPAPSPCAGMLLLCGGLVNGPYALITTAVSADLVRSKASWEIFSFVSFKEILINVTISVGTGHTREPARERQGAVDGDSDYWWDGINRYVGHVTWLSLQTILSLFSPEKTTCRAQTPPGANLAHRCI